MTEKHDERLRTKDKGDQFNGIVLFFSGYLSSFIFRPLSTIQ